MIEHIPEKCPHCGQEELRPVQLGNDRDGWQFTGEFECDNCDETFSPFEEHDCHASPEDGCKTCDDYQEYKDREIRELNANK